VKDRVGDGDEPARAGSIRTLSGPLAIAIRERMISHRSREQTHMSTPWRID
jgi:hypothetical protein